ncbi:MULTISPECIES: hypothetical protein [unclassified Bosea (in: a-proteobacteria)]|uniref:hypothetical protein n=1 Tax=unclassified Bosea (in: a-proteobacteria) TaxID=2653178 RepID=UPI000F752ED3|nr:MULTISPECIES: hypothetical protein [unclassified Bosea (in: a-proteobacteria)]AZO81817.1 hypothetical protein BLM15_28770 [Bosea sp. Tri-49]RXT24904.1 hypothetical protein B5U98_07985 [Bosea sp. Tri-39]RXT33456.1 hypothetical protein B5U99_18415 [Bosea sp. Tri-54]
MHQLITAIQSEDDRERVLLRIQEMSGATEQSPEEVELILLTLSLELWELHMRTADMAEPSCRSSSTRGTVLRPDS